MRFLKVCLSIAAALISLTLFQAAASAENTRSARVHWVIDGDTFEIEGGERVRLIGIDSPEYEPWKNYVQFYGKEAAEYAKSLLTGKTVLLEEDVEKKDRYGRTLAYVYLEDGQFVNLLLVQNGSARAKYYRPNIRRETVLKNAERIACAQKKGLWSKSS